MTNLGPILDHLPAWLMVLFRLTGIFLFTPVLGSRAIPSIVKVFLVVGLSLCIYPMLLMHAHPAALSLGWLIVDAGTQSLSLWALVPGVATELLIGYVIGYCASLPLIGLQMSGSVIDQQMGISAGGLFNPDFDAELGVTGQLLFLAGLTVFLLIGGHHMVLVTLIGSFENIPIATFGQGELDIPGIVGLITGLLTVVFDMAFRIAAPVLCILFLLKVALGFIGRTVPQMNILSVGFIFYILAGIAMMIVGVSTVIHVFEGVLLETLQQLRVIFTM